jgi:hypothetical protein
LAAVGSHATITITLLIIDCEADYKLQLSLADDAIIVLLQCSDAYVANAAYVVMIANDSTAYSTLVIDRVGTDDAFHH